MFSRLEHDISAVLFPKDWAESLKQILLNIYGDKCLKDDKTFEIYGFSYPKEVVLIISYTGLDKFIVPVTLFISADLANETNTDKIMDIMFDSAGVFFDTYFANLDKNGDNDGEEIWEDYVFEWEETEFSNQKLFYKITRENVALSMQADLLLGK